MTEKISRKDPYNDYHDIGIGTKLDLLKKSNIDVSPVKKSTLVRRPTASMGFKCQECQIVLKP
jgi:hypothetical protein